MFGLGDDKPKKAKEFVFELEKELKDKSKKKEIETRITDRLNNIKNILRKGGKKGEFDELGVVLYGYTALLKVMSRFKA